MAPPRRPSMADRTMSTPHTLDIKSLAMRDDKASSPPSRFSILTPPASPISSRHSRSSTDLSISVDDMRSNFSGILDFGGLLPPTTKSETSANYTADGTLVCPYEVESLQGARGENQIFGSGAWSTVYKATCYQSRAKISGLLTPPVSPHKPPPILAAVKKPSRKDAIPIVKSEAKSLTHLMSERDHELYVVEFYGIIVTESSLVLAAIPQSLEDHIKKSAAQSKAVRSTRTMTQPVIGSEKVWLDLAHKLVSALSWLHNEAMVVHGDIKPGNILLSSSTRMSDADDVATFPYEPLFADFSSSQILSQAEPTPNTLSAVTREYTAPELLNSKVLSDPNSAATTDSDVFSLAVTLLVAATGNTMVYTGSMFQRQFMATQGWGVINNVRSSDEGIRVPRQGVVQRSLERAVLKAGLGRIDAQTWKEGIEAIRRGEPSKK